MEVVNDNLNLTLADTERCWRVQIKMAASLQRPEAMLPFTYMNVKRAGPGVRITSRLNVDRIQRCWTSCRDCMQTYSLWALKHIPVRSPAVSQTNTAGPTRSCHNTGHCMHEHLPGTPADQLASNSTSIKGFTDAVCLVLPISLCGNREWLSAQDAPIW